MILTMLQSSSFRRMRAKRVAKTNRFLNVSQCEFAPSYHSDQPLPRLKHNAVRRSEAGPIAIPGPYTSSSNRPYITNIFPGDTGRSPSGSYEPQLHLLLDFSTRDGVNPQGNTVQIPPPQGVSGCGVWRLSRPRIPPEQWKPDDFAAWLRFSTPTGPILAL